MSPKGQGAFNEVIHAPVRLRICGVLRHADRIEFRAVRETLAITDAHLSKNLKVLTDTGYVALAKESSRARDDARRLTWVRLTRAGKRAFDQHIAALHSIASGSGQPSDTPGPPGRPREAHGAEHA